MSFRDSIKKLLNSDLNFNVTKKYDGLVFRKASNIEFPVDVFFDDIFKLLCQQAILENINPNFTEGERKFGVTVSDAIFYPEFKEFIGETISWEVCSELIRNIVLLLISSECSKLIADLKDDHVLISQSAHLLVKDVTKIHIISPLVANALYGSGDISLLDPGSYSKTDIMPKIANNIFVDNFAVFNYVFSFDPSKYVFDFTDIVAYKKSSNDPSECGPRLRFGFGIELREVHRRSDTTFFRC